MSKTFETFHEIEIEVEYSYYGACRGHRDKYGAPEEPDEPAHIEIEFVVQKGSKVPINLTDEELDKLEQEIMENIADEYSSPED